MQRQVFITITYEIHVVYTSDDFRSKIFQNQMLLISKWAHMATLISYALIPAYSQTVKVYYMLSRDILVNNE